MSVADRPIFVDDATVARLLTPAVMASVIRAAFVDLATAPDRLVTTVDDGRGVSRSLLAMPALKAGGLATIKLVMVRRDSTIALDSHLLAFDRTGRLVAIIEAHTLTARRTAAASVLAAHAMGAGESRRLAILGAGRQAEAQFEAFLAACPLTHVAMWARRPKEAERLARAWQPRVPVTIASTPSEAACSAEIISCATGASHPVLLGEAVASGTHVDLVGGFRPEMREADDQLISRSSIVADTAAALTEAGDLTQPLESGLIDRNRVMLLADLLTGAPLSQTGDVNLFKSVGHAAEDLVATELLLAMLAADRSSAG